MIHRETDRRMSYLILVTFSTFKFENLIIFFTKDCLQILMINNIDIENALKFKVTNINVMLITIS